MKWSLVVVTLLVASVGSIAGPPRIGIVGGGIGGTAAAYFLRQKFGADADIVIFEESPELGGRLANVNMAMKDEDASEYQTGGSVIHPKNLLIQQLMESAGLSARPPPPEQRFAIWRRARGEEGEPMYKEYFDVGFLQKIQLVFTYGYFSLSKIDGYVGHMLTEFSKIYPFLEEGRHWSNVKEMLLMMSPRNSTEALDQTKESLAEVLSRNSVSRAAIDELVAIAVRTNYGQMPSDVHAFVGSIALAGIQGGLWAIQGGNHLLPQALKKFANAKVVPSRASAIRKDEESGMYLVQTTEEVDASEGFDIVIVAAPQTSDKNPLDFEGGLAQIAEQANHFPGKYHRTVATLVRCDGLKPEFFGGDSTVEQNFYVDKNSKINSIAKQFPANSEHKDLNVYKVFSQSLLSDAELDEIFVNRSKTEVVDWLAYPHYNASLATPLQGFRLSERLYYTSAVEWAGSAAEMSAIAAKNVANLAYNEWNGISPSSEAQNQQRESNDNDNQKVEL